MTGQATPAKDFVNEVLGSLQDKFRVKNGEYRTDRDRGANFTDGAALQGETPEQALIGYVSKQMVSLCAAKHQHTERLTDPAFIEEKAGDVAVYMIILLAMTREK